MEIFFQNLLNDDLNYYIFRVLHKIQLNEVFNELFQKIKHSNILQEIVNNYDCTFYITVKRGKLIPTLHYPVYSNGTGWIVYLS